MVTSEPSKGHNNKYKDFGGLSTEIPFICSDRTVSVVLALYWRNFVIYLMLILCWSVRRLVPYVFLKSVASPPNAICCSNSFFFLISLVGFIHFTTCSMCELDFCSLFLFLMPLTILVMAHVEWLRMCVCVLWMPLEPKEKRLYCFVSSCDMAANPLQIGRHAQIHHWILKMA